MTDPQDPYAAPGDQPPPTPPPGNGTPPPPPPGYGAPPPGYGAPPPGYGAPPPGYGAPPPGYGSVPPPGYGAPMQAGTNTLAIVGFIASFLCGPAGIIMGVMARNQIRQRGQKGEGLAIAAIVIGALNMLFGILITLSG